VSNFPASYPITAGVSLNVGIIGTPSIANTGFGASVTNFPVSYPITAGGSINVGIIGTPSIANTAFGVSVSNFPSVQQIGGSVFIGSSVLVRSVDFDIRDLAATTDKVGVTGFVSAIQSGTWNIGVSVSNLPIVQSVGVTNIVNTRSSIDYVMNGNAQLAPSFKYFDAGASGDATVVSGLSGYRVQVLQYSLTVGISVNLQWNDGVTNMSGNMPFGAPGGIASPYVPFGVLRTGVSFPLLIHLSAGSSVSGHLTYVNI